ncbi:MAG: SAM-dependent methyltransferase [Bdellovibrio sp.]|nr:MAG: SAM-dependent methyltransferase [Bdellovibrio sp.]
MLHLLKKIKQRLDNQYVRDEFIHRELAKLAPQSRLLDAGCGSQRYRSRCDHLVYQSQDFGKYSVDEKKMLGSLGAGGTDGYAYGQLDYVSDIWKIPAEAGFFDAILCTEVLEHIPYPNETIKEFARLLGSRGKLILTAPSNCLRHMDPYFFYSGFSDRWFEHNLKLNGFVIDSLQPVGDYFGWMSVEVARSASSASLFAKISLAPAFLYYFFKKKTQVSTDTLCMGYHVVAHKNS